MRVGVVGAGMSGLTVTRALAERDVDVQTFEARDRPGGIVWSQTVDGHVLELGPQRLRATPGIESLIDALGLRDQLRIGDDDQPLYIYRDGALHTAPLSLREAVSTDLLSLRGKLRVLAEPVTGEGPPGETVEAFLTRKFGAEAATRCFGPLYSGLYGTDPQEMLVEYSLGRALENAGIDGSILLWAAKKLLQGRSPPPVYTFDDGLGALSQGLYEAHADRIALGEPVETIRDTADGFGVVTPDRECHVDELVLTTPAGATADLVADMDETLASTLRRFRYNPIAMVFLESAFDRPGIGTLLSSDTDARISGLTWNASFLGRDGVFTAYLDPTTYPAVLSADDDTIGAVAASAFERITGAPASPIDVHRWDPGMPAYDRSWRAMEDLSTPDGLHLCANYVGRPGLPGRLRRGRALADRLAE